jgi:hypothetical protein
MEKALVLQAFIKISNVVCDSIRKVKIVQNRSMHGDG